MEIADLQVINRCVITIIPRKPFFDWVNSLDAGDPLTPENFPERTAYLVNDADDMEAAVKKHYSLIFENQLNGMWTDPKDWPKERSFKVFKEWFAWEIGLLVFDLEKGAVRKG